MRRAAALLLLLASCDSARTGAPAGNGGRTVRSDGGARDAAAVPDGAASDGAASDGAASDGAASDGAVAVPDGGRADAGALDASRADALCCDAALAGADAAPPRDAALAPDAAAPRDAGFAPDAAPADAGSSPYCRQTCTTAADCAMSAPIYTASHWTCDGTCVYHGCQNDTECAQTFGNPRYVCAPLAGGLPSCQLSCSVPSDCAQGSPLVDADNYRCTNRVCEWTGCNSDQECEQAFMASGWACARRPGWTLSSCLHRCTVPADCASNTALNGPDNYRCTSNLCDYLGCNSDQECIADYQRSGYTCR